VEYRSSQGCDGRSLGRTQGASISIDMGATEDAARGRAARPCGTDCISPNPPDPGSTFGENAEFFTQGGRTHDLRAGGDDLRATHDRRYSQERAEDLVELDLLLVRRLQMA
jgi:hypothetical protein